MRDIKEIEKNALLFWSKELAEKAADASVIPLLLETQEEFIGILLIANKDPFLWKEALNLSKNLPANLFLKHLMVLADIGGEKTQRISRELEGISGKTLEFTWREKPYSYKFQTPGVAWTNDKMKVDGKNVVHKSELTPIIEDVANFILFAGNSTNPNMPQEFLDKCILGNLIGDKTELDKFVKQRYIWVSRICGGATSNDLGYLAQNHVIEYLSTKLPKWSFKEKSIKGISQNERTNVSFDIVARSPKGKFCAIEASFQVTTNSVIERKAGQAKARQELLHQSGHKIAYIIDGSGNFTRESAIKTINSYSDCTVTFKESELDYLIKFLLEFEGK